MVSEIGQFIRGHLWLAVACVAVLCVLWGAGVQRGLYRDQCLGLPAYLALSVATVAGLVAVSVGLHWLV